jgi:DMSO reductase anchor subunit
MEGDKMQKNITLKKIILAVLLTTTIIYVTLLALDVNRYLAMTHTTNGLFEPDYAPYPSSHSGQRFGLAGLAVASSWLIFAAVRRRNKALVGVLGFLLILASVGVVFSQPQPIQHVDVLCFFD